MKLPTTLVRDALAEARLDPTNADEERWWASAKPVIWRREKYLAVAKAAATGMIVVLVRGAAALDGQSGWGEWVFVLLLGLMMSGLFLGFFLFQAHNQLEADEQRLRKARRMHRAILAEGDAE
jgi:hypothetical protein